MPAGREAAVPDVLVPDDVSLPAEPAVLPADPDGVEPTVLLVEAELLDVVLAGAWSFTVLVLTSQH